MTTPELMSVAQVARILGITRQAARKRIATGRLEATGVGHGYVVPRTAVSETATEPLTLADPALAEVVRRLVDAYRPERAYLFGWTARGDVGPDSDYDILLVMPDDTPPELHRS